MKIKSLLFGAAFFAFFTAQAQEPSVDEILDNYYENTGGRDAWNQLEAVKLTAKVNQGGTEIPLEIVQTDEGHTYTKISFQGKEFMQNVYNGEEVWSTNFQTMQAEKADAETTANVKLEANDFPDALLNYKENGYTAEMMGKETIEGTETYKIKLVKEPVTVNGEEMENVIYYFFETENFVPIAQETEIKQGPMKGQIQQVTMSDYQEVEGLYFPFSMSQGIKGQGGQPLTITAIELNPDVEESAFAFPAQN